MSNITLDEMVPLLTREASARAGTLLSIFCLVSFVFLITGLFWQKKYTSEVQLYVDDSNIVAPIIGTEQVISRDQANVAKEELFAIDIVDRILEEVGFVDANTTAAEREEARTTGAFEFIISQVETYRNKLEDSESRLESFRSQYPGISTSTEGNVNARIVELQRDLEQASILYAQADQRRSTLQSELSNESSTLARDYQLGQTREQISRLQAEIDLLSLSYTDDYPDIIRLRQQIEDTKLAAQRRSNQVNQQGNGQAVFNVGGNTFSGSASLSPVYQQLRSDLARTSAEADALQSKMRQLQILLDKEIERSATTSQVERRLSELTRDYEINQRFYEDLLGQEQNARLMMTLGAEQQGVLYRIHQPATFPARPNGLRFVHIVLAGIVLATVLPFLYLFVFLKVDPRIRTASAVTDALELPLLTVVPHMASPNDETPFFRRPSAIMGTVGVMCALYVVVFVIKYYMEAAGGGSLL